MDLQGKVSIVTGAAKRVGKAIALELASAGSDIALHYRRSRPEAEETRRQVEAKGVRCRIFQADLASSKAIDALVRRILRSFGHWDVLVNSASVFTRKPLEEAVLEDFDGPYRVNLRAPALLTKHLGLGNFKLKRTSRIINLGDVGGMLAWPGYLPYSLSKAGVFQLTRTSAKLLAPHVLVNCIAPGPILMPEKHTAAQKAASLERTLLKRLGGEAEVARAVRFLAESDYITGVVLPVDGGRMLAN
jgi:NAD(P)-dependent dehydrogenase (short-subunit alcohol dehydrogenase family)